MIPHVVDGDLRSVLCSEEEDVVIPRTEAICNRGESSGFEIRWRWIFLIVVEEERSG